MLSPRENPLLFGHAAAEQIFEAAVTAGRMHHAWLLTGPSGVGKATLAYRLARRLLGGPEAAGDPRSPVFRRVAAGSHADLLTIEREYDEKRKRLKSGDCGGTDPGDWRLHAPDGGRGWLARGGAGRCG